MLWSHERPYICAGALATFVSVINSQLRPKLMSPVHEIIRYMPKLWICLFSNPRCVICMTLHCLRSRLLDTLMEAAVKHMYHHRSHRRPRCREETSLSPWRVENIADNKNISTMRSDICKQWKKLLVGGEWWELANGRLPCSLQHRPGNHPGCVKPHIWTVHEWGTHQI